MKLYFALAILPIFITLFYQVVCESTTTISTQNGSIKGSILISDHGNRFVAFRGIPYAQPPINSLRFKPPVAANPWNGVLDATKDAVDCLQVDEFATLTNSSRIKGDENCLFLNVYRNENYPTEKFPVMVFIHGGGYMSGSGSLQNYGPHRFMDKNIVLVTLNHRLGPFGFLSTNDEAAPGNYALLDVVLALRWVKTNIAEFGGDENKVTIFGVSAGSGVVSLLLLSPLAKGLFHGAIMQSGNALTDWGFQYENPLNVTLKLAKEVQCKTDNHNEMIECLQAAPAIALLEKSTPLEIFSIKSPLYTFRPTVDRARRSHAFLPHPPKQQLLKGDISIVPIMSGTARDEGLMFYLLSAIALKGLNRSDSEILINLLDVVAPVLMLNVRKGNQNITVIFKKYLQTISNDMSLEDRIKVMSEMFGGDSHTAADNFHELYAKRGGLVYPYKFTYRGHQSWIELEGETLPHNFIRNLQMVAHGDELQYQFRCAYFNDTNLYGNDYKMAQILLTLWDNFAQSKIPYFEEKLDDYQCEDNYLWNVFDYNNPQYLDLNLESKIVNGYLSDSRDFWNKVYNFWDKSC